MFKRECWYAVQTRSNWEKKVRSILFEKGIKNYLPTFSELHDWKDRKTLVERPVFPGYLFVQLMDSSIERLPVLRTDGVLNILGQGPKPEPVPDHELAAVKTLLDAGGPCHPYPLLREGAWVRVKRGPLKGAEGLLVRVKNRNRLVLSITLLSQSVATEIDTDSVQFLHTARARTSGTAPAGVNS